MASRMVSRPTLPRRGASSVPAGDALDICFVVAPQNKGWILEAMCEEVARRAPGAVGFHVGDGPLPVARSYFFSHYLLFFDHRRERAVRKGRSVVLFTHPGFGADEARSIIRRLKAATVVMSMSTVHAEMLVHAGLSGDRVVVSLAGADPDAFRPSSHTGDVVGLCSAFHLRKAPDLLFGVARALPHRRFRLLGRGWERSARFSELMALDNFEYLERPYAGYADFYAGLDVFLSPSRLEGGPIPLLEAMMSDVVPVATRTGFAPDLIHHGVNGFLCDVDASADVVAEHVEQAFALDARVRASVEHLTWDRFAAEVLRVTAPHLAATERTDR